MSVVVKAFLTLFLIVSSQFICGAQDSYIIERTTIERKNSHKTYCRDTISVHMNNMTVIDGFYLYPDTLFFSVADIYVNLPNPSHKQIDYFAGKKIYDVFLFENMSEKASIKAMPDTVAILSFWYGGDANSSISFNDGVQVVEKRSNDLYSETFGEKNLDGNTIYFRKRDYNNLTLSIILINCLEDKFEVCNRIFDSIKVQKKRNPPPLQLQKGRL